MYGKEIPGIFLFHSLHRAHRNAVQAELTAHGLQDVGQPMILFVLQGADGTGEVTNQRELADRLHVSPATIATSLKSLERMGYVEKWADQQDGRCKRVTITAKGREAVKTCQSVFHRLDDGMMVGFAADEIKQLDQYHRRMLENLRRLGGEQVERRPCL